MSRADLAVIGKGRASLVASVGATGLGVKVAVSWMRAIHHRQVRHVFAVAPARQGQSTPAKSPHSTRRAYPEATSRDMLGWPPTSPWSESPTCTTTSLTSNAAVQYPHTPPIRPALRTFSNKCHTQPSVTESITARRIASRRGRAVPPMDGPPDAGSGARSGCPQPGR